MNCPECGSDNDCVKDSRHRPGGYIYRRRECKNCGSLFTTNERIETEKEVVLREVLEQMEKYFVAATVERNSRG